MVIRCYNETHPWLLFIDIEFDQDSLVQLAATLFKRIDENTYQLATSVNQYVTTSVCSFFENYTNITQSFVSENGITLENLKVLVQEDILKCVEPEDLLVISHGLRGDRQILKKNGINLSAYTKNGTTRPIDGYCTFNNAKRILHREEHLKLEDIANEAGYFLSNAHNAYNDMWAEVAVFTYLRKKEYEELLEKENS